MCDSLEAIISPRGFKGSIGFGTHLVEHPIKIVNGGCLPRFGSRYSVALMFGLQAGCYRVLVE